ncbi:hypothetical protein G7Y89_g13611 [Cudoniella acicularis]|uniref:Uncharacterized protein n=1 Tax=Cudoniella acicularis TaxID=354080 RepID=A0A8H4R6X5_9HELO|nr:hypothetical protein G7Y89_g13611 [Cudoniella acicularis]
MMGTEDSARYDMPCRYICDEMCSVRDRLVLLIVVGKISRKVRWLLLTILGPELITSYAFGKYLHARRLLAELRQTGIAQKPWKPTHAFYLGMDCVRFKSLDGFEFGLCTPSTTEDGWEYPTCNPGVVKLRFSGYLKDFDFTKEDIQDRSKADAFSKAITVIQATWFVTNAMARAIARLPLCPLEISTVAYVFCTCITYTFWWSKPKDIGRLRSQKSTMSVPRSNSAKVRSPVSDEAASIFRSYNGEFDDPALNNPEEDMEFLSDPQNLVRGNFHMDVGPGVTGIILDRPVQEPVRQSVERAAHHARARSDSSRQRSQIISSLYKKREYVLFPILLLLIAVAATSFMRFTISLNLADFEFFPRNMVWDKLPIRGSRRAFTEESAGYTAPVAAAPTTRKPGFWRSVRKYPTIQTISPTKPHTFKKRQPTIQTISPTKSYTFKKEEPTIQTITPTKAYASKSKPTREFTPKQKSRAMKHLSSKNKATKTIQPPKRTAAPNRTSEKDFIPPSGDNDLFSRMVNTNMELYSTPLIPSQLLLSFMEKLHHTARILQFQKWQSREEPSKPETTELIEHARQVRRAIIQLDEYTKHERFSRRLHGDDVPRRTLKLLLNDMKHHARQKTLTGSNKSLRNIVNAGLLRSYQEILFLGYKNAETWLGLLKGLKRILDEELPENDSEFQAFLRMERKALKGLGKKEFAAALDKQEQELRELLELRDKISEAAEQAERRLRGILIQRKKCKHAFANLKNLPDVRGLERQSDIAELLLQEMDKRLQETKTLPGGRFG